MLLAAAAALALAAATAAEEPRPSAAAVPAADPAPALEPTVEPARPPAPAADPAPPAPAPEPAAEPVPYSPPQMSWGPSGPAGAGVDPAHAFSAYRGVDVGIGVLGGTLSGEGTAGVELELLADLDRVAAGLRMSLLGGGAVGVGLGLTAGARVPLSAAVRLDLLGDAGFAVYSLDDESVTPYGVTSTEDSTATLGLFAARAGITWEYRRHRYLRLGGIVRHVPPETVTYRDTTCVTFLCGSATEEVTYGGTTIGGYLIFGGSVPSERRR